MGGVVETVVVMMGGVVARTITIRSENRPMILRRFALVAALRKLKDSMNQRRDHVGAVG